MKKIKLIHIVVLLSTFIFLNSNYYGPNFQTNANEAEASKLITSTPTINAKASMLIDAKTGQILHRNNESEALPVLSASKLLSAFVIYDQIAEGNINLDDKISISSPVADLANLSNFSNVPLETTQTYTVSELLNAGLVVSANGAIMALAEAISGSEQAFVNLMKEKATEIGLKNTFLFTSTGLTSQDISGYGISVEEFGANLMSARDSATLCMELVNKYPEIIEITKKPSITFPSESGIEYSNVDAMLTGFTDPTYIYDGVQGLKTGSSDDENTAVFFGYYNKENIELISIVIGAQTKESRFSETKKLLDYALTELDYKTIIDEKSSFSSENFELLRSNEKIITPYAKDSIYVFTDKSTKVSTTTSFMPSKLHYREFNKAYTAPINQNDEIGVLFLKIEGINYLNGTDKTYTVNVVADKNYEINENRNRYQNIKDFIYGIFQ